MRLVVLGDPVAHSLSPVIHTAALAAAGLRGSYTTRRVDDEGMAGAVDDIRDGILSGANVTMPHKELAARLCDRLAPAALRAGVVNTLVHVAGQVVGHNTDMAGIRAAWQEAKLPGGQVLILGAGGAAAAALIALDDEAVSISSRREGNAVALVKRVGVTAGVVEWGSPITDAVVVNATPIGMNGEELPAPVLAEASGLFDMPYGAAPTPAVAAVRSRGLPVADGPAMLLHQAAVSFELWTGRPAPRDSMRDAMHQALGT